MEPASSVHPLSPAEDLFRRFKYHGYKPRQGQAAMIEYVSDHPDQAVYNGIFPTGYGKTDTAAAVYDIIRMQGRGNRLLIVVPTDIQRGQYGAKLAKNCDRMGIPLIGVTVCDGEPRQFRKHRENKAEVFITTVQAIRANTGYFLELMGTGRWLVFCDEYHKLRAEAAWGQAIGKLNSAVMLGLTATPLRTDGEATVFGSRPPDVEVSFKQAYEEKAIRGVVAHIEHYFVDVQEPDGTVHRLTTEEIGEERSFDGYQKARDLRMTGKYLAGILSAAHDCLEVKNLRHPGQHQMLVFAMSVLHAKSVSAMLNAVYGPNFSDWIGVKPDGRTDTENAAILQRYSDNQLACLVQVEKAGEGFDNPRSSVLVFLNLLRKNTVKAIQQGGRGVRVNSGIGAFKEDICDMFASPDTEMAALIRDFAMLTVGLEGVADAPEEGPEVSPREPTLFDIPPFTPSVSGAEFDRAEIIQREMERISQEKIDEAVNYCAAERLPVTDEQVRRVLAQMEADRLMKAAADLQNNPETLRQRVDKAVGTLAGNVVRLLHGSSFDKTIIGDAKRLIHSQWKRLSNLGHGEMLEEEFRRKYEWVQELNRDIRDAREVPSWLRL